ncbi:hypothetical protein [Reinekea sp. G2M2-21]|uniref:hypothetical protein n=1 Tax=Reinekea sp. G2M2-21 TaxID=2788942 RepID=UPI0018ABC173|nr:hypothetical protein [Reinekea sp. G2M2-21]
MTLLNSLPNVFRANAVFCIACALDMLLFSRPLAAQLGGFEPTYLMFLSLGLIAFAGFLVWASIVGIGKPLALFVIAADIGWVVGSLIVLAVWANVMTLLGQGLILGVAVCVLLFAVLEQRALKQHCQV